MLSTRSILILFLLSTVLQFAYGRFFKKKQKTGNNDFDLLIFTQHWPETVCFQWKEKVPSHRCFLPRREEWTIHGVWPTQFHKIGPAFCNKSLPFDESALSPIVQVLDDKWINIEDGTPHFSFWKHEWEKHGTCAAVLPELSTEIKYFKKGLDLLNEYDMTHVLAKANILPGQNYAVQEIIDGVQKILEKNVQIECVINPKTHESYLFEIRICFDKNLVLTDCNNISGFPTNCNRKKPVNYPGTTPSEFSVILI